MDRSARFWDRIAKRYARRPVTDEAAYQKKLQVTREYFNSESEVLEFGCGTGSTAIAHAPHVNRIHAIDISSKMLEIARGKADQAGIENVTFEQATGEPVAVAGDRLGYADPEFQASCSPPPPALPDPGEQPGDPAAEEQTIIDLMTAIYLDDEGPNDDRFDDPTGITDAREEIRSGSSEEAVANAEAIVEELVFTSPTEAWFRYRIETTTGTFAGRFGIAVNIEETWKITRNTICQDLALAGGSCGGFIDNIRPPGS